MGAVPLSSLPEGTVTVIVVPYDPLWPGRFEAAREEIISALAGLSIWVEHVGSTSVPGLAAKPKIDILVGLRDWDDLEPAVTRLLALGYERERQLDKPRTYSVKRGHPTTHRVRLVEREGTLWNEYLLFRDALRADPNLATEYGRLKQRLALQHRDDPSHDAYMNGKAPFIETVLGKTRDR